MAKPPDSDKRKRDDAILLNIRKVRDSIGERLQSARLAAGVSQDAAGRVVDVLKATVSSWEKGRNAISAAELALLVESYNSDPLYVLTGKSQHDLPVDLIHVVKLFQQLDAREHETVADFLKHRLNVQRQEERAGVRKRPLGERSGEFQPTGTGARR